MRGIALLNMPEILICRSNCIGHERGENFLVAYDDDDDDDDKSIWKEKSKLTFKLMFSCKFRRMEEKKRKEKKEYGERERERERDILKPFRLDV